LWHRLGRAAIHRGIDRDLVLLWTALRQREHLAESLRDAALLPGAQMDPVTGAASLAITRLDPFALDAPSIRSVNLDGSELTAWELADRGLFIAGSTPPARTA